MCAGDKRVVQDPSSVADTDSHSLSHYSLTLGVDFESERCIGHVVLRLKTLIANPQNLTLDALGLDVFEARVWLGHEDEPNDASSVTFQCRDESDFLGRLVVNLGESGVALEIDSGYSVSIKYQTQKNAAALCFVEASATHAKKHPFLFTQGQACLNRSLFPCFDTPSVKATYDAFVVVPKDLIALMSANQCNPFSENSVQGLPLADFPEVVSRLNTADASAWACDEAKHHLFRFEMPHLIPIYLLALAVGDLRYAEIGPRSRVWAEPTQIVAAEAEFSPGTPVEKYVATAETLYGPYHWGKYDILVCPPSFAFGGMENPMLTFVTPCLLAGDQSLLDVVAHEIAHSWSGNLVTNARFGEFFLNEGFTMYIQRRITTIVHGSEFTAMEISAGRKLLTMCIDDFGCDHRFTRLVVPMDKDTNPDDSYCETAYEKGYAFVSYLRAAAGSDEKFDAWLKVYFDTYKWKSVTSIDVLTSFFEFFPLLKGSWAVNSFNASAPCEKYHTGVPATKGNVDNASQLPELVQAYFSEHAAALSTGKTDLLKHPYATEGLSTVPGYELDRWLHQPGYAIYYPPVSEARGLELEAIRLADVWIGYASKTAGAFASPQLLESLEQDFSQAKVWKEWPIYQVLYLLDYFHEHVQQQQNNQAASIATLCIPRECLTPMPSPSLADDAIPIYAKETYTYIHTFLNLITRAFDFGGSNNAEIRLRWSLLVAEAQYEEGYECLTNFSKSQGKIKYTVPVFRALLTAPYLVDEADSSAIGNLPGHIVGRSPGRRLAPILFASIRASLFTGVRHRVKGMIEEEGLYIPE